MRTRSEKDNVIEDLCQKILSSDNFYITDISELNAEDTYKLRKLCFANDIKLEVIKNTLLIKAMQKSEKELDSLHDVLKGSSSIMFSDTGNAPAKVIKSFRKEGHDKPILKAAYVEESIYVGDDQLDALVNVKSKNELIGEIITLLQSPAKNVISGLKAEGGKLAGILQTLSEKQD